MLICIKYELLTTWLYLKVVISWLYLKVVIFGDILVISQGGYIWLYPGYISRCLYLVISWLYLKVRVFWQEAYWRTGTTLEEAKEKITAQVQLRWWSELFGKLWFKKCKCSLSNWIILWWQCDIFRHIMTYCDNCVTYSDKLWW